MHVLVEIALKSLLIAGLTLGLLQLLKRRSAAERSWIAHLGLLALVIVAFAPLVLPSWNIETPALLGQNPSIEQVQGTDISNAALPPAARATPIAPTKAPAGPAITPVAALTAGYAVPAAILLLITALALLRLFTLRARAEVLVDGHWLSALARAQRRMGFKHGTALLTSNDLASPISWGVVRPVILLNSHAVEASDEAEAIIAHELAHVAGMDWAKLLLARIATALFWFNPLVWILAREAHQLREETADDAVLGAKIPDTDYAQLLVGVARHECPGLLLGAHGVAPSKGSLARRVARVLDGTSVRGPVAGSFALGVLAGAVMIAAPLAALTVTPVGAPAQLRSGNKQATIGAAPSYSTPRDVPSDLPHVIVSGISTTVNTAVAAATGVNEPDDGDIADKAEAARDAAAEAREHAQEVRTDARDAAREARDEAQSEHRRDPLDHAIALKAVGATPEYVASIRAVAPQIHLDDDAVVGLKSVGVTPDFIQELARLGYRNLSADEITGAYAVGVRADYIRELAAAGYGRIPLDKVTALRAVGVKPADIERFRRAGYSNIDVDKLIQLKALGITPEELKASERYGP